MGDSGGMIKIGQWVPQQDQVDTAWDEKGHTDIAQIFISHSRYSITSIQFQYVEDGRLVLSQKHGGTGTRNGGIHKFDVVRLNHPNEYITWISGQSSMTNICAITFGTNLGQYGPFGTLSSVNDDFCFKLGKDQDRQFGGFYGTVNKTGTLKTIGVYLKPISQTSLYLLLGYYKCLN